jgi:hypothetical protein
MPIAFVQREPDPTPQLFARLRGKVLVDLELRSVSVVREHLR